MTVNAMRQRTSDERGWVLVTAVSLMTIMLIVALASISLVDTQQNRAREQRERESSLNVAEAVLYAQGFKLAQRWPTQASPAQDCGSAVVGTTCPVHAEILRNIDNVDTADGGAQVATTWSTRIRDNGGALAAAFQPDLANSAQTGSFASGATYTCGDNVGGCRYDANGDRRVWVEARAIVRGEPRTVVATLELERLPESTPRTAVVAGGINTGNSGSQIKVYAPGSQVVVRCAPVTSDQCVSGTGIEPPPVTGYPGNLMTPSQIERFKERAKADGTYHAGCPTNWDLRGAVVFVESCNSPNLSGNALPTEPCPDPPGLPPAPPGSGGNGMQGPCINTIDRPGLLIWQCGSLDVSGKATYVGIMYFVNGSNGACTPRGTDPPDCDQKNHNPNSVLTSSGGFGIWGALAVDGNGCITVSANGLQVAFDPNVFDAVASYGTVGLVQDTWRELAPS